MPIDSTQLFLYAEYFQQFIFMFLLNRKFDFNYLEKKLFYFGSISLSFVILFSKFSVDVISTHYIFFYMWFVIMTTFIFNRKFNFRISLCLGFLLVWINSFYWESAIYFNMLFSYGVDRNNAVQQLMHLLPIPILIGYFNIDRKKALQSLNYGLIFSFIVLEYVINLRPDTFILYYINRLFCLFMLIKIFYRDSRLK